MSPVISNGCVRRESSEEGCPRPSGHPPKTPAGHLPEPKGEESSPSEPYGCGCRFAISVGKTSHSQRIALDTGRDPSRDGACRQVTRHSGQQSGPEAGTKFEAPPGAPDRAGGHPGKGEVESELPLAAPGAPGSLEVMHVAVGHSIHEGAPAPEEQPAICGDGGRLQDQQERNADQQPCLHIQGPSLHRNPHPGCGGNAIARVMGDNDPAGRICRRWRGFRAFELPPAQHIV